LRGRRRRKRYWSGVVACVSTFHAPLSHDRRQWEAYTRRGTPGRHARTAAPARDGMGLEMSILPPADWQTTMHATGSLSTLFTSHRATCHVYDRRVGHVRCWPANQWPWLDRLPGRVEYFCQTVV
jgi:hypothetical protein